MTGRCSQPNSTSSTPSVKRPSSPSKRGQLKANQSLSSREVKNILDSCRIKFEVEMKKSKTSSAQNSSQKDKCLRAKTPNGHSRSPPNGMTLEKSSSFKDLICVNKDTTPKSASISPTTRSSSSMKKSNSAPPSPTKPIESNSDKKRRKSPPVMTPNNPTKKPKTDESTEPKSKRSSSLIQSDHKKKKAAPMDEVMKLHQDEGVMHLLHALPTSRRKTQTHLFSSSSGSVPKQSQNANGVNKMSPKSNIKKENGGKKMTSPKKRNNLVRVSRTTNVKPMSTDDLMTPQTLELLKKLPKKDYLHLWSSTSRYKLSDSTLDTLKNESLLKASSVSPADSCSVDSDEISSAEALACQRKKHRKQRIGERMLTNVTMVAKQYKDILIRSYPNFAQILMLPTTTGLRHSLNVNALEEISDAMKILADIKECKAVMLTGMGQVFCQGIDLTVLTHDHSSEKQRKSAEALSNAIKSFIKHLLNYPKLLIAGVNGDASGFGVTMLPFFDLVYASDKAVFRTDYCKFGQIPEGFASVTVLEQLSVREMLLLGQNLTASEALSKGLVSRVVWPDKFLEEIVPRIETLDELSVKGVQATKAMMKVRLRSKVMEVMDMESKELVKCWTSNDFAKNMKVYLKTSDQLIFQ